MIYRKSSLQDLDSIRKLLKESDLPAEDLAASNIYFIVAQEAGHCIGCVGLELYEPHGLLRSLAVRSTFRKKGIAAHLVERALEHCRVWEVEHLHLLTTTAAAFFEKKGFREKDRNQAPNAVKGTAEFMWLCPKEAVYMVKVLTE